MSTPARRASPSRILTLLAVALALAATMVPAGLAGARTAAGALSGLPPAATPLAGGGYVLTAAPASPRPAASGSQVLRIAGPAQGSVSMDPALARDVDTAFLVRQVFRGLTALNAQLEPVPELAQRIAVSADGLEYTFTLRANATFQDGTPITAADVVFSLERALDPATAGGDATQLGGPTYLSDIAGAADVVAGRTHQLAGVQALDARTVRIRLSAPRSTFLMKLAAAPAAIVSPRDVARGANWWQSPAGSGPFRIASWTLDSQMTLVRYDGFAPGP